MIKKLIQTAFLLAAIAVFSQEKDYLSVPGPLVFETKGEVSMFELSKSQIDPKTRIITQEYTPQSKTGERITITFKPDTEPAEIWEIKSAEVQEKNKGIGVDVSTIGEQQYVIKYKLQGDKKTVERKEIIIGLAKSEMGLGTYIIDYSSGTSTKVLNLEKLPELSVRAVY